MQRCAESALNSLESSTVCQRDGRDRHRASQSTVCDEKIDFLDSSQIDDDQT